MPVPLGGDRYVQFRYEPDYLADDPDLVTPPEVAQALVGPCDRSDLVMDGGNVARAGRVAVVTDKIFMENPSVQREALVEQLRAVLEVERIIVIPVEPGDVCGHADGVLHLLDEHTALVNDYAKIDRGYGARLGRVLREQGIEVIPTPYAPDRDDVGDVPSATGVYVNLLETAAAVFVPVYRIPSDEDAVRVLEKALDGRTIVPIECRAVVAAGGGSLHCVTWLRHTHTGEFLPSERWTNMPSESGLGRI